MTPSSPQSRATGKSSDMHRPGSAGELRWGSYRFGDASLDASGQQQQGQTSSIDAHAQQYLRHDSQRLSNQCQHPPYGIAHIRQYGFRAGGHAAVHLLDSGIGKDSAALTSPDGYHYALDYCQGLAPDHYGFPHVNQHQNVQPLSRFSLPAVSSPSSRQPGLNDSTMAYIDTGSVFHPANSGSAEGEGPAVTTTDSSYSDGVPELRSQDTEDPVPTTAPSGTAQSDVPVDRVNGPNGREDEGLDVDRGDDGSRAGAVGQGRPGETLPSASKAPNYVVHPPDLARWRQRLFDLNETVVMTNTEFETYFPHVDNVYSHRSTQRHKRRPFVSHYWDCRLKGRAPGTPKSADPDKKQRRRRGRGLGLCDVKIKIVEYTASPSAASDTDTLTQALPEEVLGAFRKGAEEERGGKVWTVQRVCGFGTERNGAAAAAASAGTVASHRHTLERSDEVKKSSVSRWVAAREKDAKKVAAAVGSVGHKATGLAAATARKRSRTAALKLYASCWCPFSQRIWIALEVKGVAYQYCEFDPLIVPAPTRLEANPKWRAPVIRQGDWACSGSGVILEFLDELDTTVKLHPTEPRLKATCRIWIDFINNEMVPAFYALLAATEEAQKNAATEKMRRDISSLVQAAHEAGPFFLGDQMCLVDIHVAPFALRMPRILRWLRGWTLPVPGSRWQVWVDAIETNVHVRNTVSAESLYLETVDALVKERESGVVV